VNDVGGSAAAVHRLITTGVVIAVVAVTVQSLLYLVNVYGFDRSIRTFDLEEGELVTWATSSAAFAVGLLALLLSFLDPAQRIRGVAIAAGAAFVSFDDVAALHEQFAFRITGAFDLADTYVQVVWPTLYFPLLVALAVLLLQMAQDTPPAQRLVVAGLLALGVAVGLEVAGLALDRAGAGSESWPRTVEVTLEEGVELAGWILIATGAAVRLLVLADEHPRSSEA